MTENHGSLLHLLKQISLINMKYEKIEEANSGAFNIFSILRNESDEVNLHSRFLGELLNPKGSHKQGSIFQMLLLNTVLELNITSDMKIDIEFTSGKDRIDILMRSDTEVVIIENKIYAEDQPQQLERYYTFARKNFKPEQIRILYLTLYGSDPSDGSLGKNENTREEVLEHTKNIAYSSEIMTWLELCAKEVYHLPKLRETIIQYSELIKKLTGQTMSVDKKNEIMELLFQGDNFKDALTIAGVMERAKIEIQKSIWTSLTSKLYEYGYNFKFVDGKFVDKTLEICNSFYLSRNRSKWYGIAHEIFRIHEYKLYLFVEIHDRIYYGVTVCKGNVRGNTSSEFGKEYPSIVNAINELGCWQNSVNDPGPCWIRFRYPNDKLNFIDMNEGNSSKLGNKSFRENWVAETAQEIHEMITACIAVCAKN